ncbi:hypothetical protein FKP32DRAFT_602926 [Trametes sanguinea]|nr:hypothetical protein FKP32DRAFT_602926 [Trametes sanguinea]
MGCYSASSLMPVRTPSVCPTNLLRTGPVRRTLLWQRRAGWLAGWLAGAARSVEASAGARIAISMGGSCSYVCECESMAVVRGRAADDITMEECRAGSPGVEAGEAEVMVVALPSNWMASGARQAGHALRNQVVAD